MLAQKSLETVKKIEKKFLRKEKANYNVCR